MYIRVLRSLFVINGHSLSKCINVTRSVDVGLKSNSQCIGQNYRTNPINFRLYSAFVRPSKESLAEKELEEYLKDPENEKRFKILQLEVEVMRQNGENVPSVLKNRHWVELIQMNSRMKRRKYLTFAFINEKRKENRLLKQQQKVRKFEENRPDQDLPSHLQYKLCGNSLMLRCYDSSMNNLYNWRLMQAMMFGQKLVFDCGYEDKMSRVEIRHCARQLQFAFATNRMAKDPFDLHFCNFDPKGFLHNEFYSFLPTMYRPDFPMNLTSKSYLDLFDKEKLVYLTPHCNQSLTTFNHDDIYIVGAIVDKVSGSPYSMAKAKREGLRMAKLPLDRYLDFGGGSGKALTLNQMVDILADVKLTGDWVYALRHVPRRKLFQARQYQQQKRLERMLRKDDDSYAQGSAPQDYSIASRNKFRIQKNEN